MKPVINYIEVPSKVEEDINRGKTTWRNGKCVMLDEGRHATVYIGHKEETRYDLPPEGEASERQATMAFPVRVKKPLTKAKAVNAAEMQAYALADALEVASLAASLARKHRENINDKDVSEHDEFIRWVKQELDATGLFIPSSGGVDTDSPTIGDVIALSCIVAVSTEMTNEQALSVKRIFPDWKAGISVKVGEKYNYNGDLWQVVQAHTTQDNWAPSQATSSLWQKVDAEVHAGTQDDPIPYNNNMELEEGKYYSQNEVTYLCTRSTGQAVYNNLSELVGIYVEVVSDEKESFTL